MLRECHSDREAEKKEEEDAVLSVVEEMKRVLAAILDRIQVEMQSRFPRLMETDQNFGFLLDVKALCYGSKSDTSTEMLKSKCDKLGKKNTRTTSVVMNVSTKYSTAEFYFNPANSSPTLGAVNPS